MVEYEVPKHLYQYVSYVFLRCCNRYMYSTMFGGVMLC